MSTRQRDQSHGCTGAISKEEIRFTEAISKDGRRISQVATKQERWASHISHLNRREVHLKGVVLTGQVCISNEQSQHEKCGSHRSHLQSTGEMCRFTEAISRVQKRCVISQKPSPEYRRNVSFHRSHLQSTGEMSFHRSHLQSTGEMCRFTGAISRVQERFVISQEPSPEYRRDVISQKPSEQGKETCHMIIPKGQRYEHLNRRRMSQEPREQEMPLTGAVSTVKRCVSKKPPE